MVILFNTLVSLYIAGASLSLRRTNRIFIQNRSHIFLVFANLAARNQIYQTVQIHIRYHIIHFVAILASCVDGTT